MAEATVRKWLDIWYGLLAEPSIPPFNEPDDMAGVLADLRRYPDRLFQAEQLKTAFELGDSSEQERESMAGKVLALWQTKGNYFGAGDYIQRLLTEKLDNLEPVDAGDRVRPATSPPPVPGT